MALTNAGGRWLGETLSTHYGAKYKPEQGRAIFDGLTDQINDEQLREAVDRHLHNKLDDRGALDGTPVGSWPPTVAHIEQQLTRMYADTQRERQREKEQKRKEESDQTYVQALRSNLWQEEIRIGAAIKATLIQRYNLHPGRPADIKIIMETLKAMIGKTGLIDDMDRAVAKAGQLLDARDTQPQTVAAEAA